MKRLGKKNILLLIGIILIFSITLGSAIVSSLLQIEGNTNIKGNSWVIYFDSVRKSTDSVEATSDARITNFEKTRIDFSVNLTNPGEFYEFTVYTVNDGSIDAMVDSVEKSILTEEQLKYLDFSVTYDNGREIKRCDPLDAHTRKRIKAIVKFKDGVDISDYPDTDTNLNLYFDINYVQKDNACPPDPVGNEKILTIRPHGGVYNGRTDETRIYIEPGKTYEIQDATRFLYNFVRWDVILPDEGGTYTLNDNLFTMGNEDVTIEAVWEEGAYVARIMNKYYTSIQEAFDHVDDGWTDNTVYLLKNQNEDPINNAETPFAFNLGGYTVTGQITNSNTGNIRLINGKVQAEDEQSEAFINYGVVTLGTLGGGVQVENSIAIIGNEVGLRNIKSDGNVGEFYFYDGYIEAVAALVGGYTDKEPDYYIFSEHIPERNDQRVYLVKNPNRAVAKTETDGVIYYYNLQDAINQASINKQKGNLPDTDYIISAVRNFEAAYKLKVKETETIIFDLDGHTISTGDTVTNNGNFTIKNTAQASAKIKQARTFTNTSNLNITNVAINSTTDTNTIENTGNLTLTKTTIQAKGGYGVVNSDTGTITMDKNTTIASENTYGINNSSNNLLLNAGTVYGVQNSGQLTVTGTVELKANNYSNPINNSSTLIIENYETDATAYRDYIYSSGNVSITNSKITNNNVVVNMYTGTLTLDNVELKSTATAAVTGTYGAAILNSGSIESSTTNAVSINSFTLNDGNVTGVGTGLYASSLTVNGGTISSDGTGASASSANIKGGTINGVTYGLTASSATISSGTINATTGIGINATNTTISGGEVNGTTYGINTQYIDMTGGTVTATDGVGTLLNNSGTITGGTISGTTYGVQAKNQINIGTNDETISSTQPVIIGDLYGLYIEGNDINFYDGILKGQTDGYYGKITGLPTGGLVVDGTETINEKLYNTDTVNAFKNWLQVGDVQFNNIDSACEAITDTGTITVIDDADIRFIQNFNKNEGVDRDITFDLNGHSIITTQPIYNHTNVTIVDSSDLKTGKITANRVKGLVNDKEGTLTIDSGEYISTNNIAPIENGNVMIINAAHVNGPDTAIRNYGKLTVNDILIDNSPIGIRNIVGDYVDNTSGIRGSLIYNGGNISASNIGVNKEGGSATVNGGTIYGVNFAFGGDSGSVLVNDGLVKSKDNNAMYTYSGELRVKGGQVISENNISMVSHSTMYVEGGYVEGTQGIQNEQYCTWYSCWYNNIEISGGHVVGTTENGINAKGDNSGQLIITGGLVEGKTNGVSTTEKARIGVDDETVSTTTPVLIGHTNYGITHSNYTEFYDGILKGIENGRYGLVSIIPDGYLIKDDYEYIDRVEYQTDYLVEKGNWLKVGDKEFNSINKASKYITAENNKMTVIADAYVDFAQKINCNNDIIFDFNGHSLIMTQPINVNSKTRFINSSDIGGINNLRDYALVLNAETIIDSGVYHSDVTTTITSGNKLTINGGEIKADVDYAISTSGQLIVNGGEIKGNSQAKGIYASGGITVNDGTIFSQNQIALSINGNENIINGGTINSVKNTAISASDGNLTINNGLIKSDEATAITTDNSYYGTHNTTINNGEVIGNTYGIISGQYRGVLTVNGGHITGETVTGIHTNSTSYINGGNIVGGQYGINSTNTDTITQIGNNDGTINIDSPSLRGDLYGLFISDSSTVYFYDGIIKGITERHSGVINSIATKAQIFEDTEVINENTYKTEYLITETDIVINDDTGVSYGNLQTAITQAKEGEHLRLIANAPLYYEINVNNFSNITLDLDGYTISTNKPWKVYVPFTITNSSQAESELKISTAVNLITNISNNLTINNVTLRNTSSSNNIINNSGILTLTDTTINCINGIQNSDELTINNGTINATGTTISNTSKLTINGGTYNGSNYSFYSNSSKNVNITNATFNGTFYNSGSNNATATESTFNGNFQNNTSNLTLDRSHIYLGRVTNSGTMTMNDSSFEVTTLGNNYYYYYQDVAMANSQTLTLNNSNVLVNRNNAGKSSTAISNTGTLNVTNNSKVFIGIENSGYTYAAISTTGGGLTTITDSEVKTTGGSTTYALYTEGASSKTILLTGIATSEQATTGYGSYVDKGTFEMGHYEGIGVTENDVSIANPMVYATGKSRGIGVKNVNASFNFYDGIIRASKYAKPETTTNVEYQFEVTTYVEKETGYEYAILEWMRNNYQGDTVCLLNDVYYKSITDAIDKANAGDTITLLKSIEEDFIVPTNKNIKLDLNKHSITTQVTNNGTLNVYNGSLQNFDKTTVINKGTLILGENDGNVSSSSIRIISEATTIQSTGTITMYDGYVEGTTAIDGKINTIAQYARVRTVHDEQSEKKFIQSLSPEAIEQGLTDLIITIDPNTGIYEGTKDIKEIFIKHGESYELLTPSKVGCDFDGWEFDDDSVYNPETGKITVNISDVYVKAKWKVKDTTVAKVGDDYYLTLQDALDNAHDGDLVELLKDTTEPITNRANVKIDLGGHTVTGAFINQGELRLVNGTIENPTGIGMINQKSLTMGENDGTVHEDSVQIIGKEVGLQQDAIFKFFDGFIEGDIALNGRVDTVPSGYFIYNDRNTLKECQRVYLIGNPANAVAVTQNGGTQYFFSLQSAIDTATITGDEIYIVRSFEAAYPVEVKANANIVINMSGYDITLGSTIKNKGTLKIYDTTEPVGSITTAKTIENSGTLTIEKVKITQNTSADAIDSTGTVNIVNTTIEAQSGYAVKTSGPFTMDKYSKLSSTGGYALYNNYDNLELNAGEVNGIYNANTLTLSDDIFINSTVSNAACVHTTETNAKLIMNGGRCDAANVGISMQGVSETFEMNGGKVTAATHAVYVVNGSGSNTTTITDGELTSTNSHAIYLNGLAHNLTVEDGTITSKNYTAIYTNSWSSHDPYRYNVTINGGTFKGGDYGTVFYYANLDINGGTFETTSTNRDRYAIWKYSGNNATINDATLIANNASGLGVIGYATVEDTTINANGSTSYGVGLDTANITLKSGTIINTPGLSSSGISLANYSSSTINYDGAVINSANIGIDTSSYNATKTINVKSGTINGDTYGINVACAGTTLTIGDAEETLSTTSPLISGGLYGVYKTTGTTNFYSGVVRGYIYGYNEDFNNIRRSKDIAEEIEPITYNTEILTYSGKDVSEDPIARTAKKGNGYAKITYLGEDAGICTTNQEWTFDSTQSEKEFTTPCSGKYKLEVWGAQGGYRSESQYGGFGGYSTGEINLTQNEVLYINVGSQGTTPDGGAGYNGGGYGGSYGGSGGGGGATHIATKSGLLKTLENDKEKVIIVAGGGGGFANYACSTAIGGNGGGYKGSPDGVGGTQTVGGPSNGQTGGSFGQGGYQSNTYHSTPGGGAGWYGGGTDSGYCGGGGGSGYIGNSRLTNKYMYGYEVESTPTEWIRNYLVSKANFLGVNNEQFNSIEAAVSYVKENLNGTGTITLLKDSTIQEDSEFASDATITFDLNGHTLQTTRTIVNKSNLTIVDSTNDKKGMIYDKQTTVIDNQNTLHIVNGVIQSDNGNGINGYTNTSSITIDEGVTIKGVTAINTTTEGYTISVTKASILGSVNGIITTGANTTVTVDSSTVKGIDGNGIGVNGSSTITVTNSTVTAKTDAICPQGNNDIVTVENSNIEATSSAIAFYSSYSTNNIKSSTLTSSSYGLYLNAYYMTINLTGNTIKCTNGIAIHDVNGGTTQNNVTISGGTVEATSHAIHTYYTNITTSNVTIKTTANSRDNYCIYEAYNGPTITINEGTKLIANTASGLRCTSTTVINDVEITANNNDGFGILTTDYGNLTILGGTIYGKKYGLYQNSSNATTTLGNSETALSITTPVIEGDTYGVNKEAGKINFYSGRVKGKTDSYNGKFSKVRKGHKVYTFEEVIDESNPNVKRKVSYLTENEGFLQVGDDPTNIYNTFEDALESITGTEATIKVLNDNIVYEDVEIPSGKNITLNLNNHKLEMTQTIVNNGTLTINGGEDLEQNMIINNQTEGINNKGVLNINNVYLSTSAVSIRGTTNTTPITIKDSWIKGTTTIQLDAAQPLTVDNTRIDATGHGIAQQARNQKTIVTNSRIIASDQAIRQNADGAITEVYDSSLRGSSIGIYQYDSDAVIIVSNTTVSAGTYALYTYGYRNTITISNDSKLSAGDVGLYHDINTGSDYTTINVEDTEISGGNYGAYVRGAKFTTKNTKIKTNSTNKDHYAVDCEAYSRCSFTDNTEISAENASGLFVNTYYDADLTDTKIESNAVSGYGLNAYDGTININSGTSINMPGYQSYGVYQSDYDAIVNITDADIYSKNIAIMVGCSRQDTKKLNVNSGTILGENYGISSTCTNNTVTIGDSEKPVSITDPHVEGGLISINKTAGTLNFYSGLLKGYARGNPGTVDNVRTGYEIFDDEDEAQYYIRSQKTISTTDHSETPISNNSKEGNGYAKISYEEYEEDNNSGSTLVDAIGMTSSSNNQSGQQSGQTQVAIETYTYGYKGNEETFVVPYSGFYQLETWGAQGGSISGYNGGYGGYATGNIFLEQGTTLYINVGGKGNGATGQGQSLDGGYNGGGKVIGNGSVNHITASGGGATHIATKSGELSTLENDKSSILIVSGGGGGARDQSNHVSAARWGDGGSGGGYHSSGAYSNYDTGTSTQQNTCIATQSLGYSFGKGENSTGNSAGGGGYYGGYSGASSAPASECGYLGSGSGGSGYIGNTELTTKHMTCYECDTSNTEQTKTITSDNHSETATADYSKEGDGAVKITYLGTLDAIYNYTGHEEVFVAPTTGYYQLETWGAQGGNTNEYNGGYGAYSTGKVLLNAGEELYINVGGQGQSNCITANCQGGYNGGGESGIYSGDNMNNTAGGGGATSISKMSGLLEVFDESRENILIVASGGGGAYYHSYGASYSSDGGNGGGITGSVTPTPQGFYSTSYPAGGGTQAAGGTAGYRGTVGLFGTGGHGLNGGSGGGAGFFGGGGSGHASTGGGSSYIGNSQLIEKHMTCYNCETSNESATKTISNTNVSETPSSNKSKIGNGYAKISYVGNTEINTATDFDYTGTIETYTVPVNGYYKLETWGAQGGHGYNSTSGTGGYGGYSVGTIRLFQGDVLYIGVGGQGLTATSKNTDYAGGYNGGGNSYWWYEQTTYNGSGGGATHIALNENLGELSHYENDRDKLLIVAAGGGGGASDSYSHAKGGNGGGFVGTAGQAPPNNDGSYGLGGTQTAGGSFVQNGRATPNNGTFGTGANSSQTYTSNAGGGSGGGAGFFGGGAGGVWGGAGGGSGYIANTELTEKHMACSGCETSDATNTKTITATAVSEQAVSDNSKIGNGYARITYIGGNDLGSDTHIITLSSTIGTIENRNITYEHGAVLGNIPQPVVDDNNLVFAGWYTDRNFTKRVNENTVVNMSATLFAKFNYSDDYCTNLVGNQVTNFDYTGNEQQFTTICPGKYKLELWGAQGGNAKYNSTEHTGGYGGYTVGYTHLGRGKTLYINVGGKGNSVDYQASSGTYSYDSSTGYNGGGYAVIYWDNSAHAGGGGATHIATKQGLLKELSNSKDSVLIVAGGGGGAGTHVYLTSYSGDGGSGGGAVAGTGITSNTTCYNYGTGGTQNSVGTYIACEVDGRDYRNENRPENPSFGLGSNYTQNYTSYGYAYSGGGAGWYGGQSGYHGPGGGGSSYLSQRAIEDGAMYGYNVEEAFTENKSNIAYLIEQRELIVNQTTNKKYLNLQTAIDEANNNEVLQYTSNDYMSYNVDIPQGKQVIIDMNGYNIITSKQITNNGTLTITNLNEEYASKITNNTNTTQIINNSTLTFNNVKLDVYTGIENRNSATLTVNNADITARNTGINNSGRLTTEGTKITGGTYDIYSNSDKTELISNTTLKGTATSYYKYNNGDTTITDSTIKGTINNAKSGQPLEVKESVITGYITNTGNTTITHNEINTIVGNDNATLIYNSGIITLTNNTLKLTSKTTYGANYTLTTLENRGTATSTNNDYILTYDYNDEHTYTYRYRYLYQIKNYGLLTSTSDDFTTTGAQYMYTIYNNSSNNSIIDGATIIQTHGSTDSKVLYNDAGNITLKNSTAECSDSYSTYGVYSNSGTVNITNVNMNIHDSNGNNSNTSYGIYLNNGELTFDRGNITLTNIKNGYGAILKNNANFVFKNGTLDLSNNINSYGVYLDSSTASYTQGIYDGRGTDEADVSISSPYISAIGTTNGLGVRMGGGTFNYYDGYITASSSPRQAGDITSAIELNYQVVTKHNDETGYDYCILEYNK